MQGGIAEDTLDKDRTTVDKDRLMPCERQGTH